MHNNIWTYTYVRTQMRRYTPIHTYITHAYIVWLCVNVHKQACRYTCVYVCK